MNCLETVNWQKKKVIFEEAQRKSHENKHPEVADPKYISGRVQEAIQKPDFVYQDLAHPKERVACYLEEFRKNGIPRYTKVVIDVTGDPWRVLTAFRPSFVKERGKCKLIYGQDI